MVTDGSNAPDGPSSGQPSANDRTVDWGLLVFLALAALALVLPHASLSFVGVYWAALVAIAIFVLWFKVMQTTCMSGGFICSVVAMMVLFNTIAIVLVAMVRFVASQFS